MLTGFADAMEALGHEARRELGAVDVRRFKRIKRASRAGEIGGRALLMFSREPVGWFAGFSLLAFHFSMEAHLMHSVTHGAYAGLPDAEAMQARDYETLAIPMQTATWRRAHKIHHVHPSLLDADPDTMHPLFRVHATTPWRPWHLFNTVIGGLFVFETWALDYDRFLKARGMRKQDDRSELKKIAAFVAYNYLLFPVLSGPSFLPVVIGTFAATTLRNYIFVAMQTASSVGAEVSTAHHGASNRALDRDERAKLQVETSKNFAVRSALGRWLVGGLDRHIEHHLWPWLPPERLHALAPKVKALCEKHGVQYSEYRSTLASLQDSFSYLWRLSFPARKKQWTYC
ncbi:MAG: fatty acid desaturase [Deltaproteobacteria bacterium]|nr:fatty acid desaturase [Deltaproteobacteria bacterium]